MSTGREARRSLVVTLPHKYCDRCTDMLNRWCEPTRSPFDTSWMRMDGHRFSSYTTTPDRYLRDAENEQIPLWMSFMRDLKPRSQNCHCCKFLLEALKASPWMGPTVYNDEDFVVIKSLLVGSRHVQTRNRDDYDYDAEFEYWNRPAIPFTKYERYYRPILTLYRTRDSVKDSEKRYATHLAGKPTFILPLARPLTTNYACDNIFHGRLLDGNVNISLLQEWFRACIAKHPDCVPKPRRRIPHFRLIDVHRRCVVSTREPPFPASFESPTPGHDNPQEDDAYQYAALSYVWGQAKRLLLTEKNLEQLSTPGILASDNDDIPQTFKDALRVASDLNIPYLWIDALCVQQDNDTQLVQHMNAMDSIYSSAVLTIVSDCESADSSIPGINNNTSRGPPQATLKYGTQTYVSAKRTFASALMDSHWESRAWCLQEKLFSKRLLVFTSSQAFYHCSSATWFEDTIMEELLPPLLDDSGGYKQQKDITRSSRISKITIAERQSPHRKGKRREGHTAYEAHADLFGRNFWSLIETYTMRKLSFENDAIRAFSGILASMEDEYGPAHWGIPEYHFARGITWSATPHSMACRRPDGMFPSWSWASWRGNSTADGIVSRIYFGNVLEDVEDIWNLDFHYYQLDDTTGRYVLTPMRRSYKNYVSSYFESGEDRRKPIIRRVKHEAGSKRQAGSSTTSTSSSTSSICPSESVASNEETSSNRDPDNGLEAAAAAAAPLDSNWQFFPAWSETTTGPAGNWQEQHDLFQDREEFIPGWGIPGHPGEEDFIPIPEDTQEDDSKFPPLDYGPLDSITTTSMPPLDQIIRFYTSVATVHIDNEPERESHYSTAWTSPTGGSSSASYAIRPAVGGEKNKWILGHVQLDKAWREEVNKGRTEFEMVYLSLSFWPPTDSGGFDSYNIMWFMLVEDYYSKQKHRSETPPVSETIAEGPEDTAAAACTARTKVSGVKKRVQLVGPLHIESWRLAEPRWECIALA